MPVAAGRGIVDRGDVDRHRVRRRIEIDAAIGRAAVVLHLEGEAGVRLVPLALAAGVNLKLPAVMSLADTNWPATTAMPLSSACRRPAAS